MIKITYKNPIYVYSESENIPMVTDEKYVQRWIGLGFKVIPEEEAKQMPQFEKLGDLVE